MRPALAAVATALALSACGITSTAEPTAATTALSSSTTTQNPIPTPPERAPEGESAFVVHVDDGDSIVVEIDGVTERVRLIGINAPEQGECLADEARQRLEGLIDGITVTLEADAEDTDRFGRLLRYVWIDRQFVNAIMAAEGLAVARAFPPNESRQEALDFAQDEARALGIGMWDSNTCGGGSTADIVVLGVQSDPAGPDEDNLNGEFVIFENLGGSVDLSGFILRDNSSQNRYVVPDGFTVPEGGRFVIYVGCGTDTAAELYWCSDGPVWSNSGDEVFLTDPAGAIVAYDSY